MDIWDPTLDTKTVFSNEIFGQDTQNHVFILEFYILRFVCQEM